MVRFAALLLVFMSGAGCVPIPFVTPPMTVSTPVGLATVDNTAHLVYGARFVLDPLQLAGPSTEVVVDPETGEATVLFDPHKHRFDVGVGYGFEIYKPLRHYSSLSEGGPYDPPELVHAATLELGIIPWRRPWGGRAGVHVITDVLFDDDRVRGLGAAAALSFEWVTPVDGAFAGIDVDSAVVGVGYGEFGLGVQATVGYRRLDQKNIGVFLFSFRMRLPTTAGVALVPIYELL